MSVDSRISGGIPGLLAREREQAWDRFLDEYAAVVLQVVHLFAQDADQVHDCFVFVCEKLRENNLRRLRRFKPEGSASFATWLRAVVRNLCLDWHRKCHGRPRPYRSIARLPELEREIFRAIHMQGLTESEAFHTVKVLYPSITWPRFGDCLVRIERELSSRQSWLLTVSTPRVLSLSSSPRGPLGTDKETEIPDLDRDPEEEAARRDSLGALRRALDHLSKLERLVVRLRFEQELSLEQIARLTAMDGPRAVQAVLHRAIGALRKEVTADVAVPVSVKDS